MTDTNKPIAYIPQWALDQIKVNGFGHVSCMGYNGPRAQFSTPLVPVYLAPQGQDSLSQSTRAVLEKARRLISGGIAYDRDANACVSDLDNILNGR